MEYLVRCVDQPGMRGDNRSFKKLPDAREYAVQCINGRRPQRDTGYDAHRNPQRAYIAIEQRYANGYWKLVAKWQDNGRGGWETVQS